MASLKIPPRKAKKKATLKEFLKGPWGGEPGNEKESYRKGKQRGEKT